MAEPNATERAAQADIAARLARAGFALPGSLIERTLTCGKANCRCMADPPRPHGPFYQWTRKIAGKTVTRRLSSEQMTRYGPWFDNAKHLRELVAELEALSLTIAERDENWPGKSR
ncbi:MAG: hypothetical protein M0Z42_16550 [Actinomycetota bacterium]|jgi:hypothetical protein|nr:hypothetical protein [Actinomycetota bacterium]